MSSPRPVRIVFIDQAKDEFERLNALVGQQVSKGVQNSEEIQLLKSIRQKIGLVRSNPRFGDNVPKHLIPKSLEITNLFRLELTHYWRMLYTLKGDEIEIVAFVLFILDHGEYDKLFGYRKR